jgi:rhomboid family GlyGly-CTERM serine protease
MTFGGRQHLPTWTAVLCVVALVAFAPGAAALLQYDRAALAAGQWWRGISGHWAHWSADHLLWDAATFAALGMLAEVRSRTRFLLCAAASSVAITAGLWFLRPDVELYRGLSGIDSALFVLVAAGLLRDALSTRRPLIGLAAGAALAGFAMKAAWELSTGTAVFVNDASAGFESLPLAHALGAGVGLPLGLWRREAAR